MERQQTESDLDNDLRSNGTVMSSSATGGAEQRPKHKLIRGSKKAVTITKREYLKTDWCKTEPFQQIIHMVLRRWLIWQINSNRSAKCTRKDSPYSITERRVPS